MGSDETEEERSKAAGRPAFVGESVRSGKAGSASSSPHPSSHLAHAIPSWSALSSQHSIARLAWLHNRSAFALSTRSRLSCRSRQRRDILGPGATVARTMGWYLKRAQVSRLVQHGAEIAAFIGWQHQWYSRKSQPASPYCKICTRTHHGKGDLALLRPYRA